MCLSVMPTASSRSASASDAKTCSLLCFAIRNASQSFCFGELGSSSGTWGPAAIMAQVREIFQSRHVLRCLIRLRIAAVRARVRPHALQYLGSETKRRVVIIASRLTSLAHSPSHRMRAG